MSDHEHEHDHDHDGEDRERDERALELEARRMIALARIRQYGDAVLRMQAREIEESTTTCGAWWSA